MANPHPKPLTVDARKAGLVRRLTYSRKWYKQQLIAIVTAQTTMSGIQFRALLEYGRVMGWRANDKKPAQDTLRESKTPRVTAAVLERMSRHAN